MPLNCHGCLPDSRVTRTTILCAGLAGAALLLILSSCQIPYKPLVTDTDGSYVRLPDKSIKAVVWGNNPDAVKSLNAWLLKQHITLVDDVKISEIANDINLPQPMSSTAVLRVAKIAGIEQVIFVDTNVSPLEASFFGHPSAYNASLFIRALNVETAEIDWNGNARSAGSS